MIRNRKPRRILTSNNITKTSKRNRTLTRKKKVEGNKTVVLNKSRIQTKNGRKTTIKKDIKFTRVEPIFKNETIYLIGGGPSLKNFDWIRLSGKKTIAINKAFLHHQTADVMYWTDTRFYTWHKHEIDSFKGLKYTIRKGLYEDDIMLLKRGAKHGLSKANDTLAHGNNSGYAAINLAYHLGAKNIVLLGYDMGNVGKESHFHDGYPTKATSNEVYTNQFLPGFNSLKVGLDKTKVNVFNACPTSRLTVFPIISIDKALRIN